MKAKHVWWTLAAVVTAAAVGTTAAVGITVQQAYSDLDHGEAYAVTAPSDALTPATPGDIDAAALAGEIEALDKDDLANYGAQIIDTTDGAVLWEKDAGKALVPASTTKVLTTAAATLALDENERLRTEIVRDGDDVIIKSAGDVWMTHEQLDRAAEEIGSASRVLIDNSVWSGPDQATGWDPANVDEGYVAPMQPSMLYGGRLGATEGDVPRSHQPARDVAQQLADRLGAEAGEGTAPEGAQVAATIESEPLSLRAEQMVKHSDNVAAEAIARELAVHQGKPASFQGATEATFEVLQDAGYDLSGAHLEDNSGLSPDNRLNAQLLAHLVEHAAEDADLRPLLTYLPVAGGEGTLYERYGDLAGKGYVRAKTGTLTGTAALAGTAQGQSGRIYAFALLTNDGELLSARANQDALTSILAKY